MKEENLHSFHIPVMGLAFTVDTPVKVARFGISSVVSIIEDNLLEEMRAYYCNILKKEYLPITKKHPDYRALRITAYLNLLNEIVEKQMEEVRQMPFYKNNDLDKFFRLLPSTSEFKKLYEKGSRLEEGRERLLIEKLLREVIKPGSIDVNIMTKVDKTNYSKDGNPLGPEFTDGSSALRGYALSDLKSSLILSAGMNPRLYGYLESFPDFFPDENGDIKKKIILKVSDFRSAMIQGKFLAKKGIWISEFRVESGLNCGGHAFATEGFLLGPILEEFKEKMPILIEELKIICTNSLTARNRSALRFFDIKVTAQGGIGTHEEHQFLIDQYHLKGTGWGSPFLLVPEVTNVDDETLHLLSNAQKEDYYLSYASPLGVPFNNFRKTSSETQRKERILNERPGSPCLKDFLSINTEFTEKPICTASRQYQVLKLQQLKELNLPKNEFLKKSEEITEKDCLCEGLGTPVLLKNKIIHPKQRKAVVICPGPNMAYFSKISTLEDMTEHIYGKHNLLNKTPREHMFINELILYIDYLKKELGKEEEKEEKKLKYFQNFKSNLLEGINYYKSLSQLIPNLTEELLKCEDELKEIVIG